MPFDNAGVYTNAAGATTAVAGDVIRSATWNAIHTDLATALSQLGAMHAVNNTVTTPGSTPASTVETTLQSVTLPAGYLGANGNAVKFRAWGTTAANANGKRVRLYFGATVVIDSLSVALNGGSWNLEAVVIRLTTSTQASLGKVISSSSAVLPATATAATPTETLTNAVLLKVTGTNVSASAGDIVGTGFVVEPLSMV